MSQINTFHRKRIFATLSVTAFLLLTTGCSTWTLPGPLSVLGPLPGPISLPGQAPAPSIGSANYLPNDPGIMLDRSETEETYNAAKKARASNGIVLHVPRDSSPIRVLPLPTDGTSVRVSDLLRQSGLQSKLGNMGVQLFRANEHSPSGLRLSVRMKNNIISPETDYALQPGDRILVREVPKSDVIQAMLGIAF